MQTVAEYLLVYFTIIIIDIIYFLWAFIYVVGCIRKIKLDESYCGQYELNRPIAAAVSVPTISSVLLRALAATSIQVTTANSATIAYVGTTAGVLAKVRLQSIPLQFVFRLKILSVTTVLISIV